MQDDEQCLHSLPQPAEQIQRPHVAQHKGLNSKHTMFSNSLGGIILIISSLYNLEFSYQAAGKSDYFKRISRAHTHTHKPGGSEPRNL